MTIHIQESHNAWYVEMDSFVNASSLTGANWIRQLPSNKTWSEIIHEKLFPWDMYIENDDIYASDYNGGYYRFPYRKLINGILEEEIYHVKGEDYPSSEFLYGLGTCGIQ